MRRSRKTKILKVQVDDSFRLYIDGSWTARELASLMRSLEDIYNLCSVLSFRNFKRDEIGYRMFPLDRRVLRRLAIEVTHAPPLMVPQFRYASPGFADIMGAGKALKQLKEFLFGITDRIIDAKPQRLKNESAALDNAKKSAELRRYEADVQPVADHDAQMRALSIEERQLRNQLLAEEVRAASIKNADSEVSMFASSISKLMEVKELDAQQQAKVIQWIGSRAHPVHELTNSGKLRGIDANPLEPK